MGRALIFARHMGDLALERQIEVCRDWCHEQGHSNVRVRQERGSMTALELAHHELDKEELDFDLIVATSADRYDRDAQRLLSLVNQAERVGVQLFTVDLGELSAVNLSEGLMVALRPVVKRREQPQEELHALNALGMKRVVADFTMEELAAVDSILAVHDDDDVRSALRKIRDGVQKPRGRNDGQ